MLTLRKQRLRFVRFGVRILIVVHARKYVRRYRSYFAMKKAIKRERGPKHESLRSVKRKKRSLPKKARKVPFYETKQSGS